MFSCGIATMSPFENLFVSGIGYIIARYAGQRIAVL